MGNLQVVTAFEIYPITQLPFQGRYEYVYVRLTIHTRQCSWVLSAAIHNRYVQLACVNSLMRNSIRSSIAHSRASSSILKIPCKL
jgi:hypothetical protein